MVDQTKEILKLMAASIKAQAIIESCINFDHCATARRYIELFYERYKNIEIYDYLMKVYLDKMLKVHGE